MNPKNQNHNQCVLQSKLRIYSADLPSMLFDVFYYGLTTIAAIYGIAAGHKYLTSNRNKFSNHMPSNLRGIGVYIIPMPDPKEPSGLNNNTGNNDNYDDDDVGDELAEELMLDSL